MLNLLRSRSLSSLTALSVVAGLALPAFGPAATTNQSRWLVLYALCLALPFCWRKLTQFEILAGAFVAYSGLSVLWSPDQGQGLTNFAHMLAGYGVLILVRNFDAKTGVVIAYLLVIVFGFIYPVGLFGNVNWSAEFVLIASPLVLWWGWNSNLKGLIAVSSLATAAVYLAFYNTSYMELPVIGAGLWFLLMRGRKLSHVLGWTALIIPLAAIAYGLLPEGGSVWNRFEIWYNALSDFAPFFGHGLGSFNYIYDSHREASFIWREFSVLGSPTQYAGAAHNVVVQILAELGIVGLLLVCLALASLRLPPFALATLLITGILALIGFPEQNPQTLLLVCIALSQNRSGHNRWVAWLVGRLRGCRVMEYGQGISGDGFGPAGRPKT